MSGSISASPSTGIVLEVITQQSRRGAAIVSFFSRYGLKIGEIVASADRTWVLNQYGQCEFTIPYPDPYCREDVVQFGNFVMITSEDPRIPVWGGIIEPPRTWGADGLHIKCYSGEYILTHRVGPKTLTVKGTCGEVLTKIFNYANSKEDTHIRLGSIFMGGSDMEETMNYSPLYKDIVRITSRQGYDWEVVPYLEPFKGMYFTLNMYERMGSDLLYPQLNEGVNLEVTDTPFQEDGPIHNDVFGYGDGSTWSSKPTAEYSDPDSISKYGLRQSGKQFDGNKETATVLKNTTEYVDKYKYPKRIFTVNVNDTPDAASNDAFEYIRLGNVLPIKLISYGFGKTNRFGVEGTVKVYGMGYNEEDGKFAVVVSKQTAEDETVEG